MTVRVHEQAETCRLAIEGEMTIYQAVDHKAALFQPLESCREMELDLSAVSELDSAGLQLLLVLKHEAKAEGGQLRLSHHSQAVFEALGLLIIAQHFRDPMIMPAEWRMQ